MRDRLRRRKHVTAWINPHEPDSIAFPLLVDSQRTEVTVITDIHKLEHHPAGLEINYLAVEERAGSRSYVSRIEVVGENDILLSYEKEETVTDPDSNRIFGSRIGTWLRFVPQQDGSYEILKGLTY